MRVAQIGNAMQNARLARQQRRGQDRQRRILRAADLDRAGERMTAVNENFIHTWRRGIASHLHSPFLSRNVVIILSAESSPLSDSPWPPPISSASNAARPQMIRSRLDQCANQFIAVFARQKGRSRDRAKPRAKVIARSVVGDVRKIGHDEVESVRQSLPSKSPCTKLNAALQSEPRRIFLRQAQAHPPKYRPP